jgi:hypothetical protein
MPAIAHEEIYALVHELFALRSRRDPDRNIYDTLSKDIVDELEAIIVVDDMERSEQQDIESEKRLLARIKVLERDRSIQRLREAKEKLALAMEQYVAAVEDQAWAEKAKSPILEVRVRADEAKKALEEKTSEFEEVKKTLD